MKDMLLIHDNEQRYSFRSDRQIPAVIPPKKGESNG